jgi:hypothetical protein
MLSLKTPGGLRSLRKPGNRIGPILPEPPTQHDTQYFPLPHEEFQPILSQQKRLTLLRSGKSAFVPPVGEDQLRVDLAMLLGIQLRFV